MAQRRIMRQLLSVICRGRVIQKLKCDLSPGSVGDPATGALPSSLKAPTNLLQEGKSWLPWYRGEL